MLMAGGAIVIVIVIVVVFLVFRSGGPSQAANGHNGKNPTTQTASSLRQPAPASAVTKLANVPLSTMQQAAKKSPLGDPPKALGGKPPVPAGAAPTKPVFLFIGAEFCPYCAAERWSMVMALQKFGTFSNLQQTHSGLNDGNIGTWSFYGSSYKSRYLTFDPIENETNKPSASGTGYTPLQPVSKGQKALWVQNQKALPGSQYNGPGYPFMDFGGITVIPGPQYDPTPLYNTPFSQILKYAGDNSNPNGLKMDSAAWTMVKQICKMTGAKPANVCSAAK